MSTEPLTEKWRPRTLDDVVGQEKHVAKFKEWVANPKSMPGAVFMSGPPGLGKTTTARAFFHDLYGDGWRNYVLEMNASDDRGIDVIRDRIIGFARTGTLGQDFCIVFLDECDSLTGPAMDALRVPMEKYATYCRFVLACNQPNKVIQPLIDRCFVMQFKPVAPDVMAKRIREIVATEGASLDDDEVQTIVELSKGSMRKALNLMGGVDEVEKGDAGEAVQLLYKGDLQGAEASLIKTLRSQPSSSEVFLSVFETMVSLNRPNKELYILADYEFRVLQGGNLELQARCMLRHLGYLSGAMK